MTTSFRHLGIALLLIFPLTGLASLAQAQQRPADRMSALDQFLTGKVTGLVLDADSESPVPSATISLWNPADSSLVTGAITGADGRFELDRLRPGRYYLKVSYIGYASQTVDRVALTREAPQLDLGKIHLVPDMAQLEGVEVAAERAPVQFGVDRTIYNVKDQPVSIGGSATEVLQNIPSVEVDIDGRVSLRGNQNVAIMINGRPAPVSGQFLSTFLQQLPANTIERIEVIPNPSARYEPDGMAGILNIVLRQDTDLGTSGGAALSAGSNDSYNASANLGYQRGRLTLFANYGYRSDQRNNMGHNFRENRFIQPITYLEQDITGLNSTASHVFNANADYRLGRRDVFSTSMMLSGRDGTSDGANLYSMLGSDRLLTGQYNRLSAGESDGFNMNYTLGFKRTIEASRHEFSTDVRYNFSRNNNFNRYTQQILTLQGNPANDQPILQTNDLGSHNNRLELQVDYTRPLGGTRLEVGYKGSLREIDNDFYAESFNYAESAYLPELGRNNAFVFDEQVHAGYGILSRPFGKLNVQAGLRAEQALTTFHLATTNEAFDNNYFSLFPSAVLAYRLTDRRQLRASYSKRIERPRTQSLNPFTSYDDPLHLFTGNPHLRPEYIHAFEVGYQQFSELGSISITPFFRRTVDVVRRIRTIDDEGISTVTFRNLNMSDSYGAEIIGSVRLGRYLNGFANFNAHQIITDGSNVESDLGSSALSWSGRVGGSMQLLPGLDLQMFYFYRAPLKVEQGHMSSFSMANIALRQRLLDDKGHLSLRVSDPFNTMGFGFSTDSAQLYQQGHRKFDSRHVMVSFTYNFGQQPRNRNRGQRDDMPDREPDDIGIQ